MLKRKPELNVSEVVSESIKKISNSNDISIALSILDRSSLLSDLDHIY